MESVIKAANFAANKHTAQRRKNGDIPYINHPIGVANSICEIGKVTDPVVLQAALLHDTVEDTATTFEELEREFGKEVAGIVREVSDDKSLSKDERKRILADTSSHHSHGARLVLLADKLYNIRDILISPPKGWDSKRTQGYIVWVKKVVDGVRGTNEGLEKAIDEVFKQSCTLNGETFPALPDTDLAVFLEEYYAAMKLLND